MKKRINIIDLLIKNANELLQETHRYIKWQAPLDIESMSRNDKFKVSREAMRITVRISQIIGWLMLQKAILEGEIFRDDILSDKLHILQGKGCLDSSSETDPYLPPRLQELLKESRELYLRTMRLEEISLKVPPSLKEIRKMRMQGYHAVPLLSSKKNTTESR